MLFLIIFAFIVLIKGNIAPLTDDALQELITVQNKIRLLYEKTLNEIIDTQKDYREYLSLVENIIGQPISLYDPLTLNLNNPECKLTQQSKYIGFLTFRNILLVLSITIFVSCFVFLLKDHIIHVIDHIIHVIGKIIKIFYKIPELFYELALYGLSIYITFVIKTSPDIGTYIAFTGCLLFSGAAGMGYSKINEDSFVYFALICIFSSFAAITHASPLIGVFATIAMYWGIFFADLSLIIKQKSGEASSNIDKAMKIAFIFICIFVILRITELYTHYVKVFELGALLVGSIVGYFCLLIKSSLKNVIFEEYIIMQIICIIAGIIGMFIGSVYHITELQYVSSIFSAVYCMWKINDIPYKDMRKFAYVGMIISGSTFYLCMQIKN